MTGPTKCWHCGDEREPIWATIRVAGYLDEFDVTLCGHCTQELFSTVTPEHITVEGRRRRRGSDGERDREQQRAHMRDV